MFCNFPGTGNCRMTLDGVDYIGPTNHTYMGIPCQRWDSQNPHRCAFFLHIKYIDAYLLAAILILVQLFGFDIAVLVVRRPSDGNGRHMRLTIDLNDLSWETKLKFCDGSEQRKLFTVFINSNSTRKSCVTLLAIISKYGRLVIQ